MMNFRFLGLEAVFPASIPLKCDLFGIGELVSSLIGASSQEDTNRMQYDLAQEQMEHQSSENQKSRDWSEEMWNKQNLYNTPSAMMERYKEGGLNPFLVNGSQTVGAAGPPVSPSSSSQGSVPSFRAPQPPNFSGFRSDAQLALQSKGVDADVANQRSQTVKNIVDASREAYKIGGVDYAQKILDTYLPLGSDVKNSPFVAQYQAEVKQMEWESEMSALRYQLQERFGYQQAEKALEILGVECNKLLAETDKVKSDLDVNKARAKELLESAAEHIARAANLGSDTELKNRLMDSIVKSYKLRAQMDYYDEQEASAEFENTEGIRLFKRLPEAKQKRLEAETSMNPKYNKRAAAVKNFGEIVAPLAPWQPSGSYQRSSSFESSHSSSFNGVDDQKIYDLSH